MLTIPCLIGAYNLEHQNAIDCILFSRCVVYTFQPSSTSTKAPLQQFLLLSTRLEVSTLPWGHRKKRRTPSCTDSSMAMRPSTWRRPSKGSATLGVWSLGGVSVVLIFFPGWVVIRSPSKSNRRYLGMKRMESLKGNAANAEYLQSLTIVDGCPNWIKLDPFPKILSKNNPRNKLRIDSGKSSKYMSPFLLGPAWHHFKLLLFKVRRTWRETFRARLGNARIGKERKVKTNGINMGCEHVCKYL